jgi:hypothetical protein
MDIFLNSMRTASPRVCHTAFHFQPRCIIENSSQKLSVQRGTPHQVLHSARPGIRSNQQRTSSVGSITVPARSLALQGENDKSCVCVMPGQPIIIVIGKYRDLKTTFKTDRSSSLSSSAGSNKTNNHINSIQQIDTLQSNI